MLRQRYRLRHVLGEGGMGAVYMAHDTQLGDRLVAVKEMGVQRMTQQGVSVAEAVQRFQREAHLLAGLQHPSLPVIHEYFQEEARWYLVMSFINGQTLQAALDVAPGNKLPVQEVVRIGVELCKVLDYLHTHEPQIIFRDLKPSNIMLTPKGQIYLIDFGIARHFKQEQSTDVASFYSVGYAPLEQYGQAPMGPRSDIYSLGATLHQMLSGDNPAEHPFQFANLHIIDPMLPSLLVQLITQMLEMQEQNRPVSARVVQAQLENVFRPGVNASTVLAPARSIPPTISVASMPITTASRPRSRMSTSAPVSSPSSPRILSVRSGSVEILLTHTLTGHTGKVYSVVWSADGRTLASGSWDKRIKVWNGQTGRLLYTLSGHKGIVKSVAWSPDGQVLASGSLDNTMKLWDAQTERLLRTLTCHANIVQSVAWSPDGQMLAGSCSDGTIKVWNTQKGQLLRTLASDMGDVLNSVVAWSADGRTLASSNLLEGIIKVWDGQTGHMLCKLTGHGDNSNSVAWSPDGRTLASGCSDGTIKVWDGQTGQLLRTLTGHTDYVNSVAWSPAGQLLASGSNDSTLKLWDGQTGQLLRTLTDHKEPVLSVAWSPDGQILASGGCDKTMKIWCVKR